MKSKVLITGAVPKVWLEELYEIAEVTIWNNVRNFLMPRKELISEIEKYEAVINFAEVKVDEELLRSASQLKIIANCSIGFGSTCVQGYLGQQCTWLF